MDRHELQLYIKHMSRMIIFAIIFGQDDLGRVSLLSRQRRKSAHSGSDHRLEHQLSFYSASQQQTVICASSIIVFMDQTEYEFRCGDVVDDEQLFQLIEESKPANTRKQEKWSIGVWRPWAIARNSLTDLSHNYQLAPVELDIHFTLEVAEIRVQRFIMESKNTLQVKITASQRSNAYS